MISVFALCTHWTSARMEIAAQWDGSVGRTGTVKMVAHILPAAEF